jgi:hypothetical protein
VGLLGGHERLDERNVRPSGNRHVHSEQISQPKRVSQYVVLPHVAGSRHHPDGLNVVTAGQVGQSEGVVDTRIAVQ